MNALNEQSTRAAAARLLAASFVVLYQELTLIRWLGSQVRVLAYFPNVVLLSAFLGLGAGSLLARRPRSLLAWWPPLLLLVLGAAWAMSRVAFTQESVSEHLWLLYYDLPKDAPVVHNVQIPIVATFLLTAASFVPLGQLVARQLRIFREQQETLAGYGWDLAGSLVGVIGFAIASFAGSFPVSWFLVIFAVALVFLGASAQEGIRRGPLVLIATGCFAAILALVYMNDQADAYSPYYALRKVDLPENRGFLILANGSQHQYAAPSRRADVVKTSDGQMLRAGYHFPYEVMDPKPRRVLALGAGSGNDATVALDEGAEHVDAVEIDPVILEMGREFHPDRPYSSPKVETINNDARSFLNHTDRQYDLIVFGAIDSLTRLSALSNVRLDNFVYTRQCIAAARRHMKPGGGLVLYFAVTSGHVDAHLRSLLASVFGEQPRVATFGNYHRLYLAGPAFARLPMQHQAATSNVIPTDDWPYLYLAGRTITPFYLGLMAMFSGLAVVIIGGAAGVASSRRIRFDGPMFFFGVAFLLLETKSVTEMSLVWGSTWLTSAVVFGTILLMILVATILMRWKPMPWRVAATGLVVALLANYLIPLDSLLTTDAWVRLVVSILFVGTPIFFAAIAFALQFRDENEADIAFGWNLLGAVAGGLLEFTSMAIGLKALSLIALGAYLMAFAFRRRALARASS
jgi:hypothetical protein